MGLTQASTSRLFFVNDSTLLHVNIERKAPADQEPLILTSRVASPLDLGWISALNETFRDLGLGSRPGSVIHRPAFCDEVIVGSLNENSGADQAPELQDCATI